MWIDPGVFASISLVVSVLLNRRVVASINSVVQGSVIWYFAIILQISINLWKSLQKFDLEIYDHRFFWVIWDIVNCYAPVFVETLSERYIFLNSQKTWYMLTYMTVQSCQKPVNPEEQFKNEVATKSSWFMDQT